MSTKYRQTLASLSLAALFSTYTLAQEKDSFSSNMQIIRGSYLLFPICIINKDITSVRPIAIEVSLYPKAQDSMTESQMRQLSGKLYTMWSTSAFPEKTLFMKRRLKSDLIEAEMADRDSEFNRVMKPYLLSKVAEVIDQEGLANKVDYSVGPISFTTTANIVDYCHKSLIKRQTEKTKPQLQ